MMLKSLVSILVLGLIAQARAGNVDASDVALNQDDSEDDDFVETNTNLRLRNGTEEEEVDSDWTGFAEDPEWSDDDGVSEENFGDFEVD